MRGVVTEVGSGVDIGVETGGPAGWANCDGSLPEVEGWSERSLHSPSLTSIELIDGSRHSVHVGTRPTRLEVPSYLGGSVSRPLVATVSFRDFGHPPLRDDWYPPTPMCSTDARARRPAYDVVDREGLSHRPATSTSAARAGQPPGSLAVLPKLLPQLHHLRQGHARGLRSSSPCDAAPYPPSRRL